MGVCGRQCRPHTPSPQIIEMILRKGSSRNETDEENYLDIDQSPGRDFRDWQLCLWLPYLLERFQILWGGVPAGLRPIYTICMFVAAVGYFALAYFVFRLDLPETKSV